MRSDTLYWSYFLVHRRPMCVYDWRLREKNLDFLNAVDGKYFAYLAEVHQTRLTAEPKHQAATALRIGYHHGIETLLTLLCAALQAPDCVFAWIQKCRTEDLRSIVGEITTGRGQVFNKVRMDAVTWTGLSKLLFEGIEENDPAVKERLLDGYSRFWTRLSHEFLSEHNQTEYNSLKHGFRTRPGGFSLAIGTEVTPGIPAPHMRSIGGSEFGSSFLIAQPPRNSSSGRRDPIFYTRSHSVNWNPTSIAHGLELIAISIGNVVGAIRALNVDTSSAITFQAPVDLEYFEKPWLERPGVNNFSMDIDVDESEIANRRTGREILEILRGANECRNVPLPSTEAN